MTLTLLLAALGHLSVGETTYDPRPFDPLNAQEQESAIAAALGDARIQSELSERYVVIGASLNTDKAAMKQAEPPRRADVVLYDYSTDAVFQLIVDIRLGAVVERLDVPHYQPVLTGAEMVHAEALAASDVASMTALPAGHEILRASHLWTGKDSGCPGLHRCVLVGNYIDGFPDFSFFIVVDLSKDAVIGTIDNAWWTEEANA